MDVVNDPDALYRDVHPDYFETQKKDLWYYERLWSVPLRQLERNTHGRFLQEFGSGPGFLLKLADRRGWLAYGVEPSGKAREHAQDIGCLCSDTPLKGFDAAIATEVLEHVDEPYDTLRLWRSCLVPGGLLAISVPNDNNPLQRLFWGKKKPWVHHTHISYFNPRTLRLLVEEAGFMVIWQRTSFPVELLLVLPIPRKWAWKLSRLWPAPPILWRFRIGRHCLLVARKV